MKTYSHILLRITLLSRSTWLTVSFVDLFKFPINGLKNQYRFDLDDSIRHKPITASGRDSVVGNSEIWPHYLSYY